MVERRYVPFLDYLGVHAVVVVVYDVAFVWPAELRANAKRVRQSLRFIQTLQAAYALMKNGRTGVNMYIFLRAGEDSFLSFSRNVRYTSMNWS